MRIILSTFAVLAFGSGVLTGCQDAVAPPVAIETARTANTANSANTTNSAAKTDEHGHADEAPRITLADAKKDFDAGSVVFVDTRAATAFKTERIKGAINLPAEAFEAKYKEIPAGKKIVAYCSWPSEHTSASLVAKLKEKGIGNAYALVGGTKAWKDAGYPMESGDEVKK